MTGQDLYNYFIPNSRMTLELAILKNGLYNCSICVEQKRRKIYNSKNLSGLKFHITRYHNNYMSVLKDKYFGRIY